MPVMARGSTLIQPFVRAFLQKEHRRDPALGAFDNGNEPLRLT